MARRNVVALLVLIAAGILGGAWWWSAREVPAAPRGGVAVLAPQGGPSAPKPAALEPAPELEGPELAPARDPAPARAAAPKVEAPAATAAPPDDSIWRAGRVVLRDGTPPDEEITVEARGKRFRAGIDGREHRAPAERDGRFRVAFAEGTRKGWVVIDARYHYLEEKATVELDEAGEIVLEPKLGGRVRGRALAPPVVSAAAPDFGEASAQLQSWGSDGWFNRSVKLDAEGGFVFDGVPPGSTYYLTVNSSRYANAQREGLAVKPGEVTELELELGLGVRLAGRVVGPDGEAVDGALVFVLSEREGNSSGASVPPEAEADGRFEVDGVAPGAIRLSATKDGFLDAELELGELGPGAVREGLVLKLGGGRVVAGRVRWPDGTPAEGVWVQLAQDSEEGGMSWIGEDTSRQKTDAEGRFRFTGLNANPCQLRASHRGERVEDESGRRYRPTFVARAEGVAVGTLELVLTLGAGDAVGGRVVDDRGLPIERFRVAAQPAGDDELGGSISALFNDEGGAFELEGLSDGVWDLRAQAKGHADGAATGVGVPQAGPPVEIVLARHAAVSGRVLSPAGEPVAGARVSVESGGGFVSYGGRRSGGKATDDEGRFELDDVEPGPRELVASADGYADSAPLELEVPPGEELPNLTLVLRRSGRIRGRVHPGAGEIAGRAIQVSGHGTHYWSQATSDAEGRFELDGLVPGTYELRLEPQGSDEFDGEDEGRWLLLNAQRRELQVELAEGATVEVVIGEPPAVTVEVHGVVRSGGSPVPGTVVSWDRRGGQGSAAARTASDGSYSVALESAGEWQVSIGSSWNDRYSFRAVVPEAPRHELDIELPQAALTGVVRRPDGEPARECKVELQGGPAEGDESRWRERRETETDEEGRYRFDRLRPGEYALVAGTREAWWGGGDEDRDYGRTRVGGIALEEGRERTVDVRLERGGALEGTVLGAGGLPLEDAWIHVAQGETDSWFAASTDEAGRYRCPGLGEGAYRVRAQHGERAGEWVEVRIRADATTQADLRID